MVGLWRALKDDRYVSLRKDGLVLRTSGPPVLLLWCEIDEVTAHGDGPVLLTLRDGRNVALEGVFGSMGAARLAAQIRHVRIRALWGLPAQARAELR